MSSSQGAEQKLDLVANPPLLRLRYCRPQPPTNSAAVRTPYLERESDELLAAQFHAVPSKWQLGRHNRSAR